MKVIDIMQKVANKEIFKFRIDDVNYYVDKSNYICEDDGDKVEWYIDDEWLNMEAELIEEDKKIEKIDPLEKEYMTLDDIKFTFSNSEMAIVHKINEIIDYINGSDKE